MAGGDDETASPATVGDRPGRLAPAAPVPSPGGEPGDATLADAAPTNHAPGPAEGAAVDPTESRLSLPSGTTAIDAMRNEEVDRTRTFIRLGWLISVIAMSGAPVLQAPPAMTIAFVGALGLGIAISIGFYRAFADPRRYTERALLFLAVMCLVNAHVAVLYFGTFTVAPLIVVIGVHFVARTEAERAARWILATAVGLYALCALAIISGALPDPGVFASDRRISTEAQLAGAAFVVGTYTLAYVAARTFRTASLRAIEGLQRATRLASQREALMHELRLDLERALRPGGPGRYTDQTIGNFKLGAVLGRGAIGEVYDAVDLATGEPAAVKLLRKDLLSDHTHAARFIREARASGALDSPYVVKVFEAVDRDPPYLAMERLYGHTLAELLRSQARLPAPTISDLVHQVGEGLDAASARGIIHRDITPQNLFHDRVWKILDFGIATLLGDGTGTLTHRVVVGTPSYMAPEQAQARRLDGRADLYALAAVAYRCLTGRHPLSADDIPALLYAVVHRMPPRPGDTVEIPGDLDRWFAIALAKLPADRFATGHELARAFDAALAGALDPKLRRQAEALLRKLPWGG